jgi:hypothetical protein
VKPSILKTFSVIGRHVSCYEETANVDQAIIAATSMTAFSHRNTASAGASLDCRGVAYSDKCYNIYYKYKENLAGCSDIEQHFPTSS